MIRLVCSLTMVAFLTSSALGDVAPPPPGIGFKRVPYENAMILDSNLPEYKFYTFERMGIGGSETVGDELQLSTTVATPVPSSSSPSVRTGVVAVPTDVMKELQSKENLAKLLSRDKQDSLPAGVVVRETRGTIRDLKVSDPRSKVENVITVSRSESSGVKFTAKEKLPPNNSQGSVTTPSSTATIISVVAAALAIVTLGIRFGRK